MLRARKVSLAVPGRVLVHGLELSVTPGEVWAVLGRNGTGKSTLIHALGGLAAPHEGTVELRGRALHTLGARERARTLGVLLQLEEGVFWGTAADYVLLGRFPHSTGWGGFSRDDRTRAEAALAEVGLADFATRRFASLSGGERQRLRLAQVLAQDTACLLLDEPLQHLDLAHQAQVLGRVVARAAERDQAAVMVMHEPLWIGRGCTHALLLDGDGGYSAGPAGDILTRERLEHAYRVRLREAGAGAERCFIPDV
jgi:iron complex transport system ATP-binding protein